MDSTKRQTTGVISCTQISPTGYILRLERRDFHFAAGELITLFGAGPLDGRDYTIASGVNDDWIEVLFRLIPSGCLTPQLAQLAPGNDVDIAGPYGNFTLRDRAVPVVFIATGTGIAPCRSYSRSFPDLRLTVLQGCSCEADLFYRDELSLYSYYPCVSGAVVDGFRGRVTERLHTLELDATAHFYLCGANEMIYEVRDILAARGINQQQIFTEPYYYRADD